MKISYTICSANYLPYAKALADSLIHFNPDHRFIIILADRNYDAQKNSIAPHTIIAADDLALPFFEEMNERYSIFELSCALKPFEAEYLFRTYKDCDLLFYFDTDIMLFGSLSAAEKALNINPLLFTPHLATVAPFVIVGFIAFRWWQNNKHQNIS